MREARERREPAEAKSATEAAGRGARAPGPWVAVVLRVGRVGRVWADRTGRGARMRMPGRWAWSARKPTATVPGARVARRWRVLGGVSVGLLTVALGGVLYGVDRAQYGAANVAHVAHVAHVAAGTARSGTGSDAVAPAAASPSASVQAGGTDPAPLPRSTPLTLAIPSVRLSAPLLGLGMDGKGAAELPPFSLPRTAGWLRDSASPGEAGTAVVVGHVDTTSGPAVFWNLAAVRAGAEVDVARLDGRTAVFTVDRVREYPKAVFPTAQVYGPSPGAQLRVVTCGGAFDRNRREYTGNVVLFAHLRGVR